MQLDSVRLRYTRDGAWVLDGVTLALRAGTVTAVIGGNGSGKSTLLKLAAGLVRPTSGSVRERPRRIGFVPERLPQDLRMSARTYLLHMGSIQGIDPAAAARRGDELLEELLIEGNVDAPISTLSKGNTQKVFLAQAMLAEQQLLVLDEPWSGLDADAHQALAQCLERQRAAGTIILLAEHRLAAVAASATAVYHVTRGRLTERLTDPARPVTDSAFVVVVLRPGPASGTSATLGTDSAPGPAADSREAAKLLADLPGVRTIEWAPSRVRLELDRGHSDAILAEALRIGYSVHEVRLVEASEHSPAADQPESDRP